MFVWYQNKVYLAQRVSSKSSGQKKIVCVSLSFLNMLFVDYRYKTFQLFPVNVIIIIFHFLGSTGHRQRLSRCPCSWIYSPLPFMYIPCS